MALFEIRGDLPPDAPNTVLGMWTVTPVPMSAVSFDVNAPPEPTMWRANLPDNQDAAAEKLLEASTQLDTTDAALRDAAKRLDGFIQTERGGGVSFGLEDETQARPPELELRATLNALGVGQQPASLGATDFLDVDWEAGLKQFQGFLDQIQQLMGDPLIVETAFEERLAARTAVRWLGDTGTAFDASVELTFRAQHGATLALALRTRVTLLRIAALAAQGAVRIASVAAVPASAILTMPAIFKFIAQVMDEFQKLHSQLQATA